MKSTELLKVAQKIRDGATGSDVPLGELLRLCMRLGKQLSNEELVSWARNEASGYKNANDLPDYRVIQTQVNGSFNGPMSSSIRGIQIPPSLIDERHRKVLFSAELMESVGQIEAYSKSTSGDMFQLPWPGDVIRYYQRKQFFEGNYVIESAYRVMSTQSFAGVLETIRTRVLDFILQIEEELGLDIDQSDENAELEEVSSQSVTTVFHNTIYGGNVSLANAGNINIDSININVGNLDQLKSYLHSLGIDEEDISSLEGIIQEEPKPVKGGFGPKVSRWLSKVSVKALKGGLSVGRDIATSLITKALMLYFGMSDKQ